MVALREVKKWVKKFDKNGKELKAQVKQIHMVKEKTDMSENEFMLGVEYDDIFVDKATISLLSKLTGKEKKYLLIERIDDQCPEKDRTYDISEEQAIKWVLEKYTNKESTSEEIKEEKMYMLYLMEISVTKIGEYFGVSRQTVHKKIKKFENSKIHEFSGY